MNQSQEEIRRIIISDMVKKRNSIVPVIGENMIVSSFGAPLVLLWSPYGPLMWIRSAFLDESSGRSTFLETFGTSEKTRAGRLPLGDDRRCLPEQEGKKTEREDGSKVTWGYLLFANIGCLLHEASLVALRTYVPEPMKIGGSMKFNYDRLYMLTLISNL